MAYSGYDTFPLDDHFDELTDDIEDFDDEDDLWPGDETDEYDEDEDE